MIWFEDPSALLKNPMVFWPSSTMNPSDSVNATTRFIIYSSIIAFYFKRDPKIFVLAVLVMLGIFLFFKINPKQNDSSDPMNNFTDDRDYDSEKVDRFMERAFPDDRRNAERPFFTMPTWDLKPFLEMQGRGKSYCRDDQSACTAEDNTHFPDETTMRAQYGLSAQLSRF
jgi:hypothetical protein